MDDMPTPDGNETVCEVCVQDSILNQTIVSEGATQLCDVCGTEALCIRLSELATMPR